jgi:NAD(P)-dependent dehydrogenase (short-subunit alcohol dehydrogenase family)
MLGLFSTPFHPSKDIPSLQGKVIIITGANGGLGYESLLYLVHHSPAKVYLCARSQSKYDAAMKGITAAVPDAPAFVKFLQIDLTSLESVKAAADAFLAENDRLDILMNNAGIMAHPPGLTKDGYEIQFGINHIGHALFTKLLLPVLQSSASQQNSDVRIVNLTSEGYVFAPAPTGFVPEACTTDMASYSTWARYGQSKLANILFTTELSKRYPNITSAVVHPGGVNTALSDEFKHAHPWLMTLIAPLWWLVLKTPKNGALNQTWAAVAPVVGKEEKTGKKGVKTVKSGEYYVPVAKVAAKKKFAADKVLTERLWEWTEAELAKHGY